jgi:hypothetical protein
MTWIDRTEYVVFPLDGVNGARRNLLAAVGRRVQGPRGRIGSAALSLSTHTRLWQFEGLSVEQDRRTASRHKRSLAFEVGNDCLAFDISTPPGWDEWQGQDPND